MKIIKNKNYAFIGLTFIFFIIYVLLLPFFSTGNNEVTIENNKGEKVFETEPHNLKRIIFYQGFNKDLIFIYKNNLLYDCFIEQNKMYEIDWIEHTLTFDYKNERKNNFKIIVNLNPLCTINLKLKKNYNFILIKKIDGKLKIIFTNNLLWFET